MIKFKIKQKDSTKAINRDSLKLGEPLFDETNKNLYVGSSEGPIQITVDPDPSFTDVKASTLTLRKKNLESNEIDLNNSDILIRNPSGELKSISWATLKRIVGEVSVSDLDPKSIRLMSSCEHTNKYSAHKACGMTILVTQSEDIICFGRTNASKIFGMTANQTHPFYLYNPKSKTDRIKEVLLGFSATYILYESGDVCALGHNGYGQLGLGHTTDIYTLTDTGLRDIDKLIFCSNGYYYYEISCYAISKTKGNKIWVTGCNMVGQLGTGNTTQVNKWTEITFDLDPGDYVKDVYASSSHYTTAYVVTEKGKVFSTGANYYYQLGKGTTNTAISTTFTKMPILENYEVDYIIVIRGYQSGSRNTYSGGALFVTKDKKVYGLGLNDQAILNTGNTTNQYKLVDWLARDNVLKYDPVGNPFKEIRAPLNGPGLVFLHLENGDLYAIGYNNSGIFNESSSTIINFKKIAENVESFFISAYVTYSVYLNLYIITKDYKMYVQGNMNAGMSGVLSTKMKRGQFVELNLQPEIVKEIKQITESGVNGDYPVVHLLLNDGTVYGWGFNTYGEVSGYPTSMHYFEPTKLYL